MAFDFGWLCKISHTKITNSRRKCSREAVHCNCVAVLSRPILVFRVAKVAQIRQVSQLEMLAKGAVIATSVWALHTLPNGLDQCSDQSRRVLASHPIHSAVAFSWLSTLCFQGTHFTNFPSWCSDSFGAFSTGGVSTPSLGQAFPNEADDGQHQLAGLFSVWHTIGQVNTFGLLTLWLSCRLQHKPSLHHRINTA